MGRSVGFPAGQSRTRKEESVKSSPMALIAACILCILGLPLLNSVASAQATRTHGHDHPDIVVEDTDSRPIRRTTWAWANSTRTARSGSVSTTPDNQILVELAPEDTTAANLFDLNGRTLVFTPDGDDGYSRSVQPVAWENDTGPAVTDGAEVLLHSFQFDFAGRRWGSFFVSRQGLVTFGERLSYSYDDSENRFDAMSGIAAKFVTTPTISPLYKPLLDAWGGSGEMTVARSPDRIVVTWVTRESHYHVFGEAPVRFQVVLDADGSIRFNYAHVPFRDGIVGLFPNPDLVRGNLLASVVDATDPDLPGHLDLLDAAIYASNTDAVILEFTLRDNIRDPPDGDLYSYKLHFDTDEPYWNHPLNWSDEDATWQIDVREGGEYTARGKGVRQFLDGNGEARISLLADTSVLAGDGRGISAMAVAGAAHLSRDDQWVQGDYDSRALLHLPAAGENGVDLSAPDSRFSRNHSEIFHYRSPPDPLTIACRVIDSLGDEFDLFVFHNEFRVDSQESGTSVRPHYGNTRAEGTGIPWNFGVPCGEGRLKAVWYRPVWMRSFNVYAASAPENRRFDVGLLLFAHEFTHAWTAHASYDRNGTSEPLFGNYCRCHWRWDLHLPAAFPWHADEAGPVSLMGGRYWRDHGDGTFTPIDGYHGGGHSWLDLYLMGLAKASEVPDMFILRNLQPVSDGDRWGPHTGDKEIVTIQQVVAAEGPRVPGRGRGAQQDFNAGFVYLLEPGQTPDPDMLRLHAEYRDKVIEHWAYVTGGRSRMTTRHP